MKAVAIHRTYEKENGERLVTVYASDGAAPKRKRGVVGNWNPSGRKLMYQLTDSIIKNRNNQWRDFFDKARERELAQHDTKHPGCKTKDGHCTARARRLICKEILKQFFLAVQGNSRSSEGLLPTSRMAGKKIGHQQHIELQRDAAAKREAKGKAVTHSNVASRKNSRQPSVAVMPMMELADGNGARGHGLGSAHEKAASGPKLSRRTK